MELLVRVTDKVHPDPVRSAKLTKRGDVIAWHPDGADWGAREIDNPEWRILSVPGLTEAEADGLVAAEPGRNVGAASPPARLRHVRLDLDRLDRLEGGKIRAPRTATAVDCVVGLEHVRAVRELKPPVFDAGVIGHRDNVIG